MIEGVISYAGLSRNHDQTAVAYPQRPGVGADHSQIWTNCGVYDRPVRETRTVHFLEHGAGWISHQPGLAADVPGRPGGGRCVGGELGRLARRPRG